MLLTYIETKLLLIMVLLILANDNTFCQVNPIVDSLLQQVKVAKRDTNMVNTYFRLWYHFYRSDPPKALEYAYEAKQLSQYLDFTKGLSNATYCIGSCLLELRDFSEAEKEFDLSITYATLIKDSTILGKAYFGLGNVYLEKADFEKAVSTYLKSLELQKDLNEIAKIHNKLGSLYQRQRQLDKALEQYKKALSIVQQLNFLPGISACLTNIGVVYEKLDKYEDALKYHSEALSIKIETGDKLGESRVLQNIGNIYRELKRYDNAKEHFERALALGKQIGNSQQVIDNLFNLGLNEFESGNYPECISYAEASLNLYPENKGLVVLTKAHALLAEAYAALKDFEKGYKHGAIATGLMDSLYDEQRLQLSNDLEAKYQNEKKEKEINSLITARELNSLKLAKSKNERNYLIAVSLLILMLGVVMFNRYHIKARSNKKLLELDQAKSHFFANISHEFRTPLTIILGLTEENLSKGPKDEDVHNNVVMHRSAKRLQNLINQLLDLSKLEAKELKLSVQKGNIYWYLRSIASGFTSFAIQRKIDFEICIPEGEQEAFFDADKVEKMVSNLLSNAFKFTPEKGKVIVSAIIKNDMICIAVENSGAGIPIDHI